ncbi:MAG TPA: hypothetical protein VLH08_01535 [Acidobacteriota bacterium]|jgi:hypothetical protein|nr:hypothetical protein [Acidobacteriota bacterium]
MFTKACIISLAIYLGIAGIYYYFLRVIPENPLIAVGLSLFLALFASAGLGVIRTAFQGKKINKLFNDAEFAAPLQDGAKTMIAGRIHLQGFPAQTPFQQKDCVMYEYDVKETAAGDDNGGGKSDFTGIKMVPCSINSNRGLIRLLGFPHLDHFSYESPQEPEAFETARRFVLSTQFEKGSLLSVGKMVSSLLDAWRDSDGSVKKDWKLTNSENIKEGSSLRERYVMVDQDVVAIGVYSAAQGGLIAPKDDSIDLYPGDIKSVGGMLKGQHKSNIFTGLLFFFVANMFVFLIYFLATRPR